MERLDAIPQHYKVCIDYRREQLHALEYLFGSTSHWKTLKLTPVIPIAGEMLDDSQELERRARET